MRSPNYYRIRRAVRIAFALLMLAGLYLISSRLWWQDSGGYCWGVGCGL